MYPPAPYCACDVGRYVLVCSEDRKLEGAEPLPAERPYEPSELSRAKPEGLGASRGVADAWWAPPF